MADYQVTCITPDGSDPDRRIDALGGPGWYDNIDKIISIIEGGYHSFWVNVNGWRDDVIVAVRRNGKKYLKTRGDGYEPNNLLSLNACPI